MKPFSYDYLAPIKTRIPRDDAVQNAWTNSSVEVSEVIETNDNQLPKAATSSKLETKVSGLKKRTFPSPKGKKFLDDATSLQSFSSGGSSPSWSRKWNSPKAMPARTLAGYKPDASREWASGPLGPLEERTSKVSKQSDEEDRQRLLDAWSSGRLIEAKRLVQKSQNMKRRFHEILDENDLEVIHRVDASFSHSLDELEQKAGTGWMKDRDEAQDLDMAFRLSKDLLQAVASTVCMGCDIVQALDGLLEYVQQHEHNDDLEVQQLNNELEQDSLLRVFRSGHGRTEDNILHCSWLDALDEPLGALWLSSYTYKHRNPKFRGVRLPPPKSGDDESVVTGWTTSEWFRPPLLLAELLCHRSPQRFEAWTEGGADHLCAGSETYLSCLHFSQHHASRGGKDAYEFQRILAGSSSPKGTRFQFVNLRLHSQACSRACCKPTARSSGGIFSGAGIFAA